MSDFDLGALEIALAAAALDPDLADWLRGACELDRDQRLGTLRLEDLPERLRLLGRSGVKAGIPVDLVLDVLEAMERDIEGGDA